MPRRCATSGSGSTGCAGATCACPPTSCRPPSTQLDPEVRAALEESIRRARLVHADQRRTDTTTQVVPRRHRSPSAGCPVDRVGLYVPGGLAVYPSSVVMNVVPAQLAGVGSLAVASPAAGATSRRAAPPDHPRRVRPAGRRRGVGGRRRAGGRAVRLRRRRRRRRARSLVRSTGHRAGQHLRRRRQAAAQGRDRHRRRGRPDRDRDPRRRHRRPRARRRRPRSARPSTTRSPPRCWSPTRASSPTRSTPSSPRRSPRPSTPSGSRTALAGPQSGDRARRRRRRRASRVVNAYAAEHLEIQTARRRRGRRPGAQRRRGLRRRRTRRSAWATTAPGPTTCCPPAGCALPLQRAVGAVVPARHPRGRLHEAALRRGRRPRRHARRRPRTCPAHGEAVPRPVRRGGDAQRREHADRGAGRPSRRCCSATTCAAGQPYGAPQLDVPVRLNTNENSYPPCRRSVVAAVAARGGRRRGRPQPLPRPGVHRRCATALAAYLVAQPACR